MSSCCYGLGYVAVTLTALKCALFWFAIQADSNTKELITPPLDGTILPGVTRDSILQLARDWGEFEVSERQLSIQEIKQVQAATLIPSCCRNDVIQG